MEGNEEGIKVSLNHTYNDHCRKIRDYLDTIVWTRVIGFKNTLKCTFSTRNFLGQGIHSHLLRSTQPSTLIGRQMSTGFGWGQSPLCGYKVGGSFPGLSMAPRYSRVRHLCGLPVVCHSVKTGASVCSTKRRYTKQKLGTF